LTDAYAEEETLAPEGRRADADAPMLARGTMLGRYVVIDTIGRGAMGVVVSAYDPELDRKVAIKVLRGAADDTASATRGSARLLREAQSLAKLAHANVVAVYDVGTLTNPRGAPSVFVAMELLVGRTVAKWLEAEQPGWREVLDVFIAAGRGLEAAHQAGVIHRDFKPDNVLLTAAGRVVVLDFGLALAGRDAEPEPPSAPEISDHRLTMAGTVMGTPMFMSPEQAQGRELDPASDQFSFCVSLHIGLFGELPYPADGPWARATWDGTLRTPSAIQRAPTWVRSIVVRGLQRDPAKRFASMGELLDALGRDPSQGRRRTAAVLVVGTAIGATWWIASNRAATTDPCAGEAAAVDAAWSDGRRAAIRSALADGTEDADAYAARVVDDLDRRVDELRTERVATCSARRSAVGGAVEVAGLRTECVDGVLQHVEALSELLEERGAAVQDTALSAVSALPDVKRCRDEAWLRRSIPVLRDPTRADEVSRLRFELARVRSYFVAGDSVAARDGFTALIDEIRATEDRRLIADALLVGANAQMQLAKFDEGITMTEEAYELAVIDGADASALNALGLLTVARTSMRPQFELAEWYSREAEALARRLGEPTEEMARVLTDRARIARKLRKPEVEVELLERAEAMLESAGIEGMNRVVILDNLAVGHLNVRRNEEAIVELERALELCGRVLGPRHHLRVNVMVHLGQAYADAGDRDRGLDILRSAVTLARMSYGAEHPSLAAVLNTLAILTAQTDPASAIAPLEEAMRIINVNGQQGQINLMMINVGDIRALLGDFEGALELHRASLVKPDEDIITVVRAHVAVADDLVALGRANEAMAEIDAARREITNGTPPVAEPFEVPLTEARIALATGDTGRAVAAARLAVKLAQQNAGGAVDDVADAQFMLARALDTAGTDRQERITLAVDALNTWAKDPRRHRVQLAEALAFFLNQPE
jgi:tetratricopeptide (TPR) repeat protein